MLSIDDAKASRFEQATLPELRAYADQLGIDYAPTAPGATLRRKLLEACGLPTEVAATQAVPAKRPKIASAREAIVPPYNLTPNGLWGGRRHRVKLPRPAGSKLAAAEGFGWNGKHPYYLPYDEVVAVPEPVLNILRENTRPRPIQRKIPMPDGSVEVTTDWVHDPMPYQYIGVDAETAHLAGSLTEWYQQRGPAWFDKRTHAELRQIAGLCEISLLGHDRKPVAQDEALARLKTFFFGYPDAIEVEDAA